MDELITQSNITPSDYKTLYPLFTFGVSKQKGKLISSVVDIQINNTPDDFDPGIDNLATQYHSIITALLDEMAPSKTVVLRIRPQRRWYDDECRKTRKVSRRLQRKFKADRKPESRSRWRDALKSSHKLSQFKAAAYWREEVSAAGGIARRVWRTLDNLLGENKSATKRNFSPEDYHDFIDSKIVGVRAATAAAPAPVFAPYTARER